MELREIEHRAIVAAFEAQAAGVVKRRQGFDRAARVAALRDLAAAIRTHEREIIAALAQDFGKPEAEVILTEILPVLQEIRHSQRHLRNWMRPKRVGTSLATFGTSAKIIPEPRGTCLIIAPWNYPFNLSLGPLVSCLAAGNAAIVKPSEMTPATSALIARLIAQTFPPDLVHVIEGGRAVSEALLTLPFDHIFFTGSPEVGKIVMAAASKHLTSVTLELGGKSPVIIGPEADLKEAARWVAFGKFANAGQTCIAPDHLYLHAAVKEDFLKLLRARIAETYGDGPRSPDLALIVNDAHAARLGRLLEDARAKGARLLTGGKQAGRAFAPTLLEAITPEMEIAATEIFGPILPVIAYENLDEVLAKINQGEKPLALYIFDKDRGRIERILRETSSGGAGVNLTLLHYSHLGLPFGGVNHSGMGAAHGYHGFRAFSHERAVLTNRFSALPLLFPPYRGLKLKLVKWAKALLG